MECEVLMAQKAHLECGKLGCHLLVASYKNLSEVSQAKQLTFVQGQILFFVQCTCIFILSQ